MPEPKFWALAASGEFVRVPYGEKSYRYYTYDLLGRPFDCNPDSYRG
jgi:hypothetical protein